MLVSFVLNILLNLYLSFHLMKEIQFQLPCVKNEVRLNQVRFLGLLGDWIILNPTSELVCLQHKKIYVYNFKTHFPSLFKQGVKKQLYV